MKATAESYGHAVVLNIVGELTEDCLTVFKQTLEHHLGDSSVVDLVLNVEETPFIDSAVLEYLVDLQMKLAERMGQVKLAKCGENLIKILEITRLTTTFEMVADLAEALRSTNA
jgi:anti-anti-sigma factor